MITRQGVRTARPLKARPSNLLVEIAVAIAVEMGGARPL